VFFTALVCGTFCQMKSRSQGAMPRSADPGTISPAFVLYTKGGGECAWRAHSLQVLGIEGDAIPSLTAFMRRLAFALVPAFGLSLAIEDCRGRAVRRVPLRVTAVATSGSRRDAPKSSRGCRLK
jgi:hypothetical protein